MRYRTVRVPHKATWATAGECHVDGLRQYLRPGDKVVSVYPVAYTLPPSGSPAMPIHIPVVLEALLELRHPSWAAEKVGWDPEEPEDEAPTL